MTRIRSTTKPNIANIQMTRQARRLAKQQRRLEQELLVEEQSKQTKSRMVRISDIRELEPLTDVQRDFFESYENNDAEAYVLHGSAGTGKTFMAMYFALLDVMDETTPYDKIILVRSSVQTRDQGHLPGTIEEKMEGFEAPYHSILADITGKRDAYEKLKDVGLIEFVSTSFLRGSTYNNSIILFDEAQNATFEELNTVATRKGRDSKFIVAGDSKQNDLRKNKNDQSGFRDFLEVSYSMSEFRSFKFTSDDIVRSGFVKSWIKACEKLGL